MALSTDLFAGLTKAPESMDDMAQFARSQGYEVRGNQAVKFTTGQGGRRVPIYTALSDLNGGTPDTFLDQVGRLAQNEYKAKQGAADRQFDRNNAEIAGVRGLVEGSGPKFADIANEGTGYVDNLLAGFMGQAAGQGAGVQASVADMLAGVKGRYGDAVAGIDKFVQAGSNSLNTMADAAVGAAREAISKYDTGVQENVIQAGVNGLRRDVQQQLKMIQAGVGPDGTRLTASERSAMARELRFDAGTQIATMASNVRGQAQNVLASLRTNLANVMLEAGKLKGSAAQLGLSGEGMKADAGDRITQAQSTGIQALLATNEGQRAWANIISNMGQFRAQTRSSVQLASLDYEMNGRMNLANLVQSNPETVIGMLSTLLAMGGIATAPGGRSLPAIRF